jgi:hypothetical protein
MKVKHLIVAVLLFHAASIVWLWATGAPYERGWQQDLFVSIALILAILGTKN